MKGKLSFFLIGVICISALSSCGSRSVLEDYDIEKGTVLNDYRIAKLTETFDGKAFDNVGFDPTWEYKGDSQVFFKEDCLFSRNELISFNDSLDHSSNFVQEKYKCEGLNLYTFEEITQLPESEQKTSWEVPFDTKCAIYYVADVQEYRIIPKDGRNPFDVYVTCGKVSQKLLEVEE